MITVCKMSTKLKPNVLLLNVSQFRLSLIKHNYVKPIYNFVQNCKLKILINIKFSPRSHNVDYPNNSLLSKSRS